MVMGYENAKHTVLTPWLPHTARDAIGVLHDRNASSLARVLAASIVEVAVRQEIDRLGFVPEVWLRLWPPPWRPR
jgi:hypothetical protein